MATTELNVGTFEGTVLKPGMVLVDFWAPWCRPCKNFAPVFEKISEEYPDAIFAKVNTEVERELAGALEIRSIPTLMIFRDGILVFRQPGSLPESALRDLVKQVLDLDMEVVKKQATSE